MLAAPAVRVSSPSGSYVLRKCLSGEGSSSTSSTANQGAVEAPSRTVNSVFSRSGGQCAAPGESSRGTTQTVGLPRVPWTRNTETRVRYGVRYWYAAALCRRGNSGGSVSRRVACSGRSEEEGYVVGIAGRTILLIPGCCCCPPSSSSSSSSAPFVPVGGESAKRVYPDRER